MVAQGIRDWSAYTQQMYAHLVPGGVVQLLETRSCPSFSTDDNSIPTNSYIAEYERHFVTAQDRSGLHDPAPLLETYLKDAGFVDVKAVMKKLPIGPWPKDPRMKELGGYGLAIIETGLKSYGFAMFTRVLGMKPSEVAELCDNAFDEFCRSDVHAYFGQ